MASSDKQESLRTGHYQGAHSRRIDRYIVGLVFAALLFKPVWSGAIFNSAWMVTGSILALTLAFCEWWFVRRRGIDVETDGLTLHFFYGRRRIAWGQIESFQWNTRMLERGEYLSAHLRDGHKVWLPTIGRASSKTALGDFFGSSNIRSKAGSEVDAMAALKATWAVFGKAQVQAQ